MFLPITVAGYSLLIHFGWIRAAFVFLTLASLAFYGFWDVRFLPLLLGSLAFNYLASRIITRSEGRRRTTSLVAGLVFNLGLLIFFKYAMFAQTVLHDLGGGGFGLTGIVLPIGLSFITFQKIAYLVDVYRRSPVQQDFLNFSLFVTFFPQLIAGPVVHHQEVMPQFSRPRMQSLSSDLAVGITIFVFGLAKKVILADSLSLVAKPVFDLAAQGHVPSLLPAWTGLLAYTLQIYFDFSGYSDMAVGLAAMFGIRLPTNFAAPYRATSIIEFWSRWHITLSRFLRDYLYIPLGGNRAGDPRRYVNIFLTMLLGGIWHGAGWTFVLWGAIHGALITINHVWRSVWRGPPIPAAASWAMTFFAVALAWVPFRSNDLRTAWRMYAGLFGGAGQTDALSIPSVVDYLWTVAVYGVGPSGTLNPVVMLVVLPLAALIALTLPNLPRIMGRAWPGLPTAGYPELAMPAIHRWFEPPRWKPAMIWSVLVALIGSLCLLKLNDVSEFIYFQF